MKYKSILSFLAILLIGSISGLSHAASDTGVAVKLAPPNVIDLQIIGRQLTSPVGESVEIPVTAIAVSLNVTVVNPEAAGFVTIWPCGVSRPLSSNLNFVPGSVVPNGVIASLGSHGSVCLYSSSETDIIVDVAGWFEGGSFFGATPERLVDTRDATGGPAGQLSPATPLEVGITNLALSDSRGLSAVVPGSLNAAALNVTVVNPDASGFITVYPCDVARPLSSNVNYVAGQVVANSVIAPVSLDGKVCFYSSTPTDLVVDLAGWFAQSIPDTFVGATPLRFVDTRDGTGGQTGKLEPTSQLNVPIRGENLIVSGVNHTIPAEAIAAALNVTIVNPDAPGFATVWPCSAARPLASNLNFVTGQTVANNVIAPIGMGGEVCLYTSVPADVVIDVSGYLIGETGKTFVGSTPKREVDTRDGVGPEPARDNSNELGVAIEAFTATLSETVVEKGNTFTVTTVQSINPLFLSSFFATSPLSVFPADGPFNSPVFSFDGVTGVPGFRDGSRFNIADVMQTDLSQVWTFTCKTVGTSDVGEFTTFSQLNNREAGASRAFFSRHSESGTVTCVEPQPKPIISFLDGNTVQATEDIGLATFFVVSDIPVPETLSVPFNVAGSAAEGPDYLFSTRDPFAFSAGAQSAITEVTVIDDSLVENDETIILEIEPSATGSYEIGFPNQFTLVIVDNDIAPEVTGHWSPGTTEQILGTAGNHTFEIDAGSLNGEPSNVTVTTDPLVLRVESLFAVLFAQPDSEIGISTTNGIDFDSTPITPFVVTAVTDCLVESVSALTANITDDSGTILSTASIDVSCTLPPASAACQSATTGFEKAYECNNDQVGVLPIGDFFTSTIVDVPIGGGAGRTVPGGTTLHLPLTLSGAVPSEADFSANGWNGSLSSSSNPVPAIFGLDATRQYMFVQYESGVDLVDLSTPDAEPITGLLNYPGRVQESEFMNLDDFSKIHDYFVMPVHSANGDFLISCGTDVVRHDYDPAADNGAGAFVANAERISNGIEVCRDIWSQSDVNGIAPGYAYTTKSVSKSQKTSKWIEDGIAEVALGGDWTTQGVDVNNRIMGGVGGFTGEHTLLASRGTNEKGLWSGIPGDAVEGSVAPRISTAALYQDVRCVESLCIATASDTLTTLMWPDRNEKPTVHQNSFISSLGLTARNMVVAANGNIYLLGMSNKRVAIGRVTPQGDFGGAIQVDVSSVCADPQSVQLMDMEHLGIMCRTDNQFKVLELLPDL